MGFLCSGTVLNTSKFFTGLTSMNPTYLTWYLRKMTEAVRH